MFEYIDNTLHCEGVPLADIAKSVGTPAYVTLAASFSAILRPTTAPLATSIIRFAIGEG